MSHTGARVLVVEDDKRLATLLCQELGQAGYHVRVAHDGTGALVAAEQATFDVILLDLNLPDVDGIEVAERLRGRVGADILMLTARGDVASRVGGLYAGASDYLTKPFSVHELLARIHVRLRERRRPEARIVRGGLELDLEARSCRVAGELLELTGHEFGLLELLVANTGRIFSRQDLEERLYGAGALPGSNTIEVFVSNLRKKLHARGVQELIRTVRGMGYVVRD